jgi:hypothetical protein
MSDYSDKLLAIDADMVALGRPPPPVVSWISGGLNGDLNARTAAWRVQLEAWEAAHDRAQPDHPDSACAARRWSELRVAYVNQEQLERRARYDDDAWNYEQLKHVGCPDKYLDVIRSTHHRETKSWRASREWLLDYRSWCLTLVGSTGCGKSVAAAWLGHQRLMRNFGLVWVDCAHECETPKYGIEAELRRFQCRETQTLVLDDVGHPRQFERKEGPWLAWLDDVVGSRANKGLKTVITTNRSPAELSAWLGARLWDRVRDGTVFSTDEKSLRGQAVHPKSEVAP